MFYFQHLLHLPLPWLQRRNTVTWPLGEVVAVTGKVHNSPGRSQCSTLSCTFLTPRMKKSQQLQDQTLLDEIYLFWAWVAALNKQKSGLECHFFLQLKNAYCINMQENISFFFHLCTCFFAHACLLIATESYLLKMIIPWLKLRLLREWLKAQAKFKNHMADICQNTATDAVSKSKPLWVTDKDPEQFKSQVDFCHNFPWPLEHAAMSNCYAFTFVSCINSVIGMVNPQ